MRKVFLSSTSKDLAEHREVVAKRIHQMGDYHCVRMEEFVAGAGQTADDCRAMVRGCELFIGILGHYHGSCPDGDERSYTEIEYETAVEMELPQLIFVAPDDFERPVNLREPDVKWRRQQAFRERVRRRQICPEFSAPETLANEVVLAIRQWERQTFETGAPKPRGKSKPRGANLGELVPRMCDRSAQEGSFHLFFSEQIKRHPGFPQIYLIHGAQDECHASLVERLSRTHLKDYASLKRGGVTSKKFTDWPHEGDLADRRQLLLARLFKEFDHNYEFKSDDFSAAAFAQLCSRKLDPVIALSHEVRAARWNRATGELLESYLQFWDEVGLHNPPPQFIIFLLVIYPPRENSGFLKSLPKLWGFDKKSVERELNGIFLPRLEALKQDKLVCPSLMLKELGCIVWDDVMDWFSHNGIYDDEKTRREKCDELIKAGDCRRMAGIERELKLIHQEFIRKRGLV